MGGEWVVEVAVKNRISWLCCRKNLRRAEEGADTLVPRTSLISLPEQVWCRSGADGCTSYVLVLFFLLLKD